MRIDRPEDRDLEEVFAQMRQHDQRRAPLASEVIARARASIGEAAPKIALGAPVSADLDSRGGRSWRRWGVPGLSVALAAALATLLLVDRDSVADREFDRLLASYVDTHASLHSPTDALLRLPGDELLRTVPRIGGMRPAPRNPESPS